MSTTSPLNFFKKILICKKGIWFCCCVRSIILWSSEAIGPEVVSHSLLAVLLVIPQLSAFHIALVLSCHL